MKRIIYILLLGVLASCRHGGTGANELAEMDWTFSRGDASLSGYTDRQLPKDPVVLWSYRSDSRTVSSPIVYRGVTYWAERKGRILGVDADGSLCFEYDLGTSVESTPLIRDSVLFVGRNDGIMTAISLTTKEVIWNFETFGQISASPNIADFEGREAVIFGSYDNYLYCVDIKDGAEINRFESGYYINGTVALTDNYALFGGCDAWLRIIDCESGIKTDSLKADVYIPSSAAALGNFCYFGDYSGNIYEAHLENGKIIRWRKIVSAESENGAFVSLPAVAGDNLYVLSDDKHLYAIDRMSGDQVWKYLMPGDVGESSPIVCRDRIIACTKTGVVSILDADNGDLVWQYDTGEQIVGSPAIIKGRFYVLTTKGTLICFGEK